MSAPQPDLTRAVFQIDDDLTARVSMADAKFSFQERGKLYSPQWFSPEGEFDHVFH